MKNKVNYSIMSHNARYDRLFTVLGKHVYGFNVHVGDVVYITDLEKYGVVTSLSTIGDRPCFSVTCRLSSGKVCEFPFTDLDCKYCVIPPYNTVARLSNGVVRIGETVLDTGFDDRMALIVTKIDNVRRMLFGIQYLKGGKLGYWVPFDSVVKEYK